MCMDIYNVSYLRCMTKDGVGETEKYYISTKNISITVQLQNTIREKHYRVSTDRENVSKPSKHKRINCNAQLCRCYARYTVTNLV